MFSIPILRSALSRTVPSSRLAALSSENAPIRVALKNAVLPPNLRETVERRIREPVETVTPHGFPNSLEISPVPPLWCPALGDGAAPLSCSCKYKRKYRKCKCKLKKAKKKLKKCKKKRKKCKKKRKKCKCKLKKYKRKYKKCKCKKKKYKKMCKK